MSETAENKTDNAEIKNGLDKYKDNVLPSLISDVTSLKTKARNLLDAVNKKKESFIAAKSAVETVDPIVNKDVSKSEKKVEKSVSKVEETKPVAKKAESDGEVKETPKTEPKREAAKEEKPAAKAAAKTSNVPHRTFAIEPEREKPVFNEPRRIFIPPEKPKPQEKKNVQTRVFDNTQRPYGNRNQNGNGPRPQFNQNGGGGRPQGARPNNGGYTAPAVIPSNNNKPQQKRKATNFAADDKKAMSRYELSKKGFADSQRQDFKRGATITDSQDYEMDTRIRGQRTKKNDAPKAQAIKIDHAVVNSEVFSIKLLSEKIGKTGTEIIKQLFVLGIIKTINENIDFETASLVASELGVELELKLDKNARRYHKRTKYRFGGQP